MLTLKPEYQIRLHWLEKRVFPYTKADVESVYSKSRIGEARDARMIIWYILRKYTDLSLKQLGAIFIRTHATVIHALDEFDNLRYTNRIFRDEISEIEKEYANNFDILGSRSFMDDISGMVFTSPIRRTNEDIGRVLLGI